MTTRDDTGVESVTEQALAFVEEIREPYDLGLHEFVSVQELLLKLADRGMMPSSLRALTGRLRPILCSNPREQEEFSGRLEEFLRRREPMAAPVEGDAKDLAPVDPWREASHDTLRLNAAIVVAVGLLALLVFAWWRYSPEPGPDTRTAGTATASASGNVPPPSGGGTGPEPPPSGGSAGKDSDERRRAGTPPASVLALTLLLVICGIGVVRVQRQRTKARSLLAIDTGVDPAGDSPPASPTPPPHAAETILLEVRSPPLLNPSDIKKATHALRARRPASVTELDLPRTMEATARNAGLVTEVRRELTEIPEYLFLVERRHPNDLECARHDELLDALARSGVPLRRLYFKGSPKVVFGRGAAERPRLFGEIRAGLHSHRVCIFTDPESLLDPVTLEPAPWLGELLAWTKPVVLTSGNRDRELPAMERLRDAGITVVADSARGLAEALGRPLPRTNDDGGFVLTEPHTLRSDARLWLSAESPDEAQIARCLAQLRSYLGTAGYYWFAACALYPQLRWPLAVQVARALEILPHDGDAETARRLTRLPWMRAGRIPHWLRRRLLTDLAPDEREAVRRAIERVMVLGATGKASPTTLSVFGEEPGAMRSAYRELSRVWKSQPDLPSPLEDAVFAREMPEHAAGRVPLAIRAVGRALERQRHVELAPRDPLQCAYGALLVGYALQLAPQVIPVHQSAAAGAGAAIAVGLAYGALPNHLLEQAPAEPTSVHRVWARAVVVFGALAGSLLGRVDFAFDERPTGSHNVVMALMLLILLGAPLALFERASSRASAVAVIVGGLAAYKVLHPVHDWTLHSANTRVLTASTIGLIFACQAVFAVVVGFLGDVFAHQLPKGLRARQRRLHEVLDRFAPDRLLLDRAATRSLPSSPFGTAIGAALLGAVFGAMAAQKWSGTLVSERVFTVAAGLALVAYPQVATRRYRQQEGRAAELRAGYESALAILGVFVGTKGAPQVAAWTGLAVVLSWLACWLTRPSGSVRMREFIERIAPDRFLGTKPAFLGVAYLELLLIAALQFFASAQDAPDEPKPDPTPGTGGTTATSGGGASGALGTGGASAGTGGEPATGGIGGATSTGGVPVAASTASNGGRPSVKRKGSGGSTSAADDSILPNPYRTGMGGVPATSSSGGAAGTGGVAAMKQFPLDNTGGRFATGGAPATTTPPSTRTACLSSCDAQERRCVASCNASAESADHDEAVELEAPAPKGASPPMPPMGASPSDCELGCARQAASCRAACGSEGAKK